jgi:hypothetical protein
MKQNQHNPNIPSIKQTDIQTEISQKFNSLNLTNWKPHLEIFLLQSAKP